MPPATGRRTGQRAIEEQLATRRRYTRAEAAQALNIKDTWLKRWVTAPLALVIGMLLGASMKQRNRR